MNGAVKVMLQVSFLAALVYVLAAVFGIVEGFSVRGPDMRLALGRTAQKKRTRQHPGALLSGAYKYANTGMVSTLMASAGTDVPRVGISQQIP